MSPQKYTLDMSTLTLRPKDSEAGEISAMTPSNSRLLALPEELQAPIYANVLESIYPAEVSRWCYKQEPNKLHFHKTPLGAPLTLVCKKMRRIALPLAVEKASEPQKSCLLALPEEIQSDIYERALTSSELVDINVLCYKRVGGKRYFRMSPGPALAKVCNQIRRIVLPLYYQVTKFRMVSAQGKEANLVRFWVLANRFWKSHSRDLRHIQLDAIWLKSPKHMLDYNDEVEVSITAEMLDDGTVKVEGTIIRCVGWPRSRSRTEPMCVCKFHRFGSGWDQKDGRKLLAIAKRVATDDRFHDLFKCKGCKSTLLVARKD